MRGSSVTFARAASVGERRRQPNRWPAWPSIVDVALDQQRAAELGLLVAEDDARAGLGRGERGREARRPGADDEHVAMRVALRVAVGIGRASAPGRGRRRGGSSAHRRFFQAAAAT